MKTLTPPGRSFLVVALIAAVLAPALSCSAVEHTKDPLDTVKKHLSDKKAVLIDVREQSEWDAGHLKAAMLLPLSQLRNSKAQGTLKEDVAKKVPEKKILYLHCRSGNRVKSAASLLKPLGYDVRPLKYGYKSLLKEGFEKAIFNPVISPEVPPLPSSRKQA